MLLGLFGKRKSRNKRRHIYVFFFFIINLVSIMKVYIDVLFLVNFLFDFLLLMGVKILLRRKSSIMRLFIASLIGEVSCLSLFLPLSTISLLLVKLLTSIMMVVVAFRYRDSFFFEKNLGVFYLLSIILGGVVYLVKLSFNAGEELIWNFFILLFISPYIFYRYLRYEKNYKMDYSLRHTIEIYFDSKKYCYEAYLDTGNQLEDPYKKRPIILVYDNTLNFTFENSILVPYKTIDNDGVLKCRKASKVILDKRIELTNILIGQSNKRIDIEGIDVILPNIIKEELCD